MTKVQELTERLKEIAKEYPNMDVYFQVSQTIDDEMEIMHTVNFCPAYAVTNAINWTEEYDIQHTGIKQHSEKVN